MTHDYDKKTEIPHSGDVTGDVTDDVEDIELKVLTLDIFQ